MCHGCNISQAAHGHGCAAHPFACHECHGPCDGRVWRVVRTEFGMVTQHYCPSCRPAPEPSQVHYSLEARDVALFGTTVVHSF